MLVSLELVLRDLEEKIAILLMLVHFLNQKNLEHIIQVLVYQFQDRCSHIGEKNKGFTGNNFLCCDYQLSQLYFRRVVSHINGVWPSFL